MSGPEKTFHKATKSKMRLQIREKLFEPLIMHTHTYIIYTIVASIVYTVYIYILRIWVVQNVKMVITE